MDETSQMTSVYILTDDQSRNVSLFNVKFRSKNVDCTTGRFMNGMLGCALYGNRHGGVVVGRSPRMREIGGRSPVPTDLSPKNR